MPSAYATVARNVSRLLSLCAIYAAIAPWRLAEHTDIPSLDKEDADEEEEQCDTGSNPSVEHKRRRLVKQSLVLLFEN